MPLCKLLYFFHMYIFQTVIGGVRLAAHAAYYHSTTIWHVSAGCAMWCLPADVVLD
jgi:hypothetical protein